MRNQGKSGLGALVQVQLTRAEERLGAALHVELAVDVVDVLLDRTDRNHEPVGDRLIGMTLGDQAQYFQLALAE